MALLGGGAVAFFLGLPIFGSIADFMFRKVAHIRNKSFDTDIDKIITRSKKEIEEAVTKLTGYQSVELRK